MDRGISSTEAVYYNDGTSFAAPIVSGLAAMMMSQNPSLSHLQVRQKILDSATRTANLIGKVSSGGVVNAQSALAASMPTPSPSPSPSPSLNLSILAGDSFGNFNGPTTQGQVALKIGKGGAFTGTVVTAAGRSAVRGKFSSSGVASVALGLPSGSLEILLKTSGLEDGRWDASDEVYLEAILRSGGAEIPFELRPARRKGGLVAPLTGKNINTLLESHNDSGNGFGFGFAGVKASNDGVFRFAGSLADGSKLTGTARAVEDGGGGWKLPVAMPLASVNGFLHGETTIDESPAAEGFHLESEDPLMWTRPANAKAKSFSAGFSEKLNVRGREWTWTKGTSALGGNTANFTLTLSAPSGVSLPTGADRLTGNLSASNRVRWSQSPPKGFSMKITPSTGLVSGKVPATQDGKDVMLPYQGILFSENLDLGSGGSARGAGFVAGDGVSNQMAITLE